MSVSKLILMRLAAMLPMLFLISLITFMIFELVPGDPARASLGPDASAAAVDSLREDLGLNDPLPVRFGRWVLNVAQGDLGNSLETNQPVIDTISRRLPITLTLAVAAITIAIAIGVVGGMAAGSRTGSGFDKVTNSIAGFILSVPDFWVGLLMIAVVLEFQLLPTQGYTPFTRDPADWALHLILPVLTLSLHPAAEIFRQSRAAVADEVGKDFVRTLRAGGISWRHTLYMHVGRNAMIPVLTVLGLQLGRLLGQTAIVETIFGINGVGSLIVQAGLNADVVTVQAVVLVTGSFVLLINLFVDVAYLILNPRLRTT